MLGRKAHAISPTTALNYGITGDALVELGRYPAAFEAFDTMATLRPGLSSYARVSHGLELLGRVPEAIETMKLAVAGVRRPGRARGLDALPARQALLVDRPRRCRRAPGPRRAQGLPRLPLRARRALADRGGEGARRRAAIALEQQAVDRIPLPQYVAQLGDLYRVDGQAAAGAQAVRADRRDRAAARRERRQDRPRDGAVRRRPRHPPARRARARPHGPRRAALDRRRRRARVGPLPQRPLRRGARATRSRPSASARATL